MLTGENGILTQAQRAKEETEEAEEDELRRLTALEAATNLENTTYEDKNGQTAPIPAGFAVSQVEGENTIENGLVIMDSEGNEFVWIPVDGEEVKYEQHTYAVKSVDDSGKPLADEGNDNWLTLLYRNYDNWVDNGGNRQSVIKYGGFYVARYEAGIPEDATFYASKDGDAYYTSNTTTSKNTTSYIPVSKKGVPVWNYISQVNALEVSKNMYNNTHFKSSLIDGYAWDTIIQWLSNCGYNIEESEWGNYRNLSFNINGLYAKHMYDLENDKWTIANNYSKGEYVKKVDERLEIATGILENSKANNIYDFAGNVYEWTTEEETNIYNTYAVLRGGSFSVSTEERKFYGHYPSR